jgi:amino acid transporter
VSTSPTQPVPSQAAPAGVSQTGMFVRGATGLVRQIGPWYALAIAIGSINIGGGFIAFFYMLGVFPHANLPVTLLLGLVASFLLGAVYVQLVCSMPRTGGDYVFTSRLLHPIVGASIGGAEFLVFATFPAFWAANFATGNFQAALASFGQLVGWNGLVHFANVTIGSGKGTFFAVGMILLIALTAAVIFSTRLGARILSFCFVAGIATLLVGLIVLLTHSNRDFMTAFNHHYAGKTTYNAVLAAGTKAGYSGGFSFGNTLSALPYAALLIWGFSWAAYPAGELRSVSKTIKWSVYGSASIAMILFLITAFVANSVLGTRFIGAANFLSTQHASLYPVPDAPSMTLYTSMLTSSNFLQLIINLIPVIAEIGIITVYLMTTSRVLFALSFDRILPGGIRSLSRWGTPGVAIGATFLSIAVMFSLAVFTSVLTVWSNGTLGLAIIYVMISIAVISLVYRHRDVWESGPRTLTQRVLGVPLIVYVGVLSAGFAGLITVLAIVKPLAIGPLNWKSILGLVLAFAWGAAVYVWVKSSYKRQGIRLDAVMTEIPPE